MSKARTKTKGRTTASVSALLRIPSRVRLPLDPCLGNRPQRHDGRTSGHLSACVYTRSYSYAVAWGRPESIKLSHAEHNKLGCTLTFTPLSSQRDLPSFGFDTDRISPWEWCKGGRSGATDDAISIHAARENRCGGLAHPMDWIQASVRVRVSCTCESE